MWNLKYNKQSPFQNSKGFTIIEIAITIGVVMIIAVSLASLISNFSYLSDYILARIGSQSDLNDVYAGFLDELRKASASANGSYVIESAGTSSLIFYSDILGDSSTERIRYFISGDMLKKGLIVASGSPKVYSTGTESISTLVEKISVATSGIFSYFETGKDASSTPLSYPMDISKIRVIKINITVVETIKGVRFNRYFTTSIAPRSILFQ